MLSQRLNTSSASGLCLHEALWRNPQSLEDMFILQDCQFVSGFVNLKFPVSKYIKMNKKCFINVCECKLSKPKPFMTLLPSSMDFSF